MTVQEEKSSEFTFSDQEVEEELPRAGRPSRIPGKPRDAFSAGLNGEIMREDDQIVARTRLSPEFRLQVAEEHGRRAWKNPPTNCHLSHGNELKIDSIPDCAATGLCP